MEKMKRRNPHENQNNLESNNNSFLNISNSINEEDLTNGSFQLKKLRTQATNNSEHDFILIKGDDNFPSIDSFSFLTNDLLAEIFLFLEQNILATIIPLVCQRFYKITKNNFFWSRIFNQKYVFYFSLYSFVF